MADSPAASTPTTDDTMVEGAHNPFVNQLLTVAQALDDQRVTLLKKVGANRDTLRSMATQGYLSPEQGKAIEEFYPTRERKAKDDAKVKPDAAKPAPAAK